MNYTLTINSQDPAYLCRVAAALSGTAEPKTLVKAPPTKEVAAQPDTAATATAVPTATTAAPPSEAAAADIPSDKQVMDAANAAVAKTGAGGQNKVKEWIAKNFQQKDGSPAGLKSIRDEQKAAMVMGLNSIAAGALAP